MKKGNLKVLDSLSFKVLDSRKIPHGLEYDVEVLKEKERGIAILKIFGPNTKKGCTLMVNKSKKHEVKFVEMLALDVIKKLIDMFSSDDGLIFSEQYISSQTRKYRIRNLILSLLQQWVLQFEKFKSSYREIPSCGYWFYL